WVHAVPPGSGPVVSQLPYLRPKFTVQGLCAPLYPPRGSAPPLLSLTRIASIPGPPCLLIPVVTVQCRDLSPAHFLVIEDPLCSFTAPTAQSLPDCTTPLPVSLSLVRGQQGPHCGPLSCSWLDLNGPFDGPPEAFHRAPCHGARGPGEGLSRQHLA
ncbi:hypothetical protein KUCAC02_026085, partial [Chaenocephalus aceratus]